MHQEKKLFFRLLLLTLTVLVLLGSPVAASITGFVARGSQGDLYEYNYSDLLDSYALKILGRSNGLYEDFAAKKPYALINSSSKYIDYDDVLDRYASALVLSREFDLNKYINSKEAKKAQMPAAVQVVRLNSGKLTATAKNLSSGDSGPSTAFIIADTKTAIVGQPEVTIAQAQQWARSRKANQRFIDIAPLYWQFGQLTGIRPEVLYVQAAIETDFGHYTSRVPPSYHNWAGIKIAGAEGEAIENHEVFASPEDGVRGHFNHISAYLGLDPTGEPHGRYYHVLSKPWAGMVAYVEELSGRWNQLPDYHSYILDLLDQIKNPGTTGTNPEPAAANPGADNPQNTSNPKPPDPPGNSPAERYVAVNVEALRLRGGPGTTYDILRLLFRGTVLKVTGNQAEWLAVITPEGENGWVHGDYVREVDLSSNPFNGKVIVIDPGHGGSDPGAVGVTGLKEKEVNLAVALILKNLLEEAGARVVMTRTGDQSVSSPQRVEIANRSKADLFISIHANAYHSNESNGTEVYYCPENINSNASRYLAHQLQGELVSALGLRSRGVKAKSYFILKNLDMPAALIEMAFITHPVEEEILRSPEMREKAARGIFRGIEAHLLRHR